jgi:dipeptidyl aminopeptidase/acylaminoacyl peptidase
MRILILLPFILGWNLLLQTGPPAVPARDPRRTKPVDDRTFNTYLDFFNYDRKLPFDLKVAKVDEDQGLRRERLSFQSTSGVRVTAILFQGPATPGTKPPGIVFLHGGSQQGKDGAGPLRFGELLSRAGWSVLSIDLQYFGERGTELLSTYSDQEKHDRLYNQPPAYLAWVTQTVKDVRRAVDFLVEQRGVDPLRTGLFGISRGAILGSIAAGADPRIAPVVLLYGGHYDAGENGHLPAACPANYITRIAPRPLLMINGTQDSDMIKARAVDPLFKLAKPPKQIIWTDGGHGFTTEEHRAAIIQWLRDQHK